MPILPCQQDFLSTRKDIQTPFDIILSYRCEIADMDCYLSEADGDLLLLPCDGCKEAADLD